MTSADDAPSKCRYCTSVRFAGLCEYHTAMWLDSEDQDHKWIKDMKKKRKEEKAQRKRAKVVKLNLEPEETEKGCHKCAELWNLPWGPPRKCSSCQPEEEEHHVTVYRKTVAPKPRKKTPKPKSSGPKCKKCVKLSLFGTILSIEYSPDCPKHGEKVAKRLKKEEDNLDERAKNCAERACPACKGNHPFGTEPEETAAKKNCLKCDGKGNKYYDKGGADYVKKKLKAIEAWTTR